EQISDYGDQDHRNNVNVLIEKITGELEKEEVEVSANPRVHSGDCLVGSHETRSLLNRDKVSEPIITETEH
ncbi:hypothetical protein A2U01_0086101, partial [Trifolium medium]|nr:hypothetical protein [Trifolium medium]